MIYCYRQTHIQKISSYIAYFQVFDRDGWHHSGDVGRQDDDGYYTITGRIKVSLLFFTKGDSGLGDYFVYYNLCQT